MAKPNRNRLELLHRLLAEDGSIWISIDDDEQAYLKVLMDEIFGRQNFINNIIWQKNMLHKMMQSGFQTTMIL
ncbi:DNA methyltransferase [Bartonella heixiaziensis]|uniref:DNA methyltransferase n=1 Tax=Bartonella heixiaziensis TaxID=1461000 RepID=UPI0039089145